MAKVAFTVDNGLVPGHTDIDLGSPQAKFRDTHISRDLSVDADINVGGDVVVADGGDVTVAGATVVNSESGITTADVIAYSIALG